MSNEIATCLGRVAVTRQGEGPRLVLAPAGGRHGADFDPLLNVLSRRFECVTFDWPSTGKSPRADRPKEATAGACATVLREVVASLGDEPAIVLGHSLGGFAAARLAIDEPDRVRGLVLVNSFGFVPFNRLTTAFCELKGRTAVTRAIEGYFARAQTMRRNAHTSRVFARVDGALTRPDYAEVTAAVWRSFPDPAYDLRQAAGAIRCPTLVCWGWLDLVIPVIGARTAARAIPGAEMALFRTGHTPFLEDTSRFLRSLDPFLKRVAARA